LQISHWRGICNVLQENGIELMIAKVPATSSAAQRAEVLLAAIEAQFPGREVNLVGHSMVSLGVKRDGFVTCARESYSSVVARQGGLDGRYLISKLKSKRSFKVASLTTIATPHRGSPFADYFIDNIIGRKSWCIPSVEVRSSHRHIHILQASDCPRG
jgi:triacylglycerol lipase